MTQTPALQCGDLLVRDRDAQWTYQFAVTVDDMDQGIDLVIRGEDLLTSTGRQLQLAQLLVRPQPARFLHHGLIRHDDGEKLSKSRGDTGVRELRNAGATAAEVIALVRRVRAQVQEVKGVDLEPEVLLYGKEWKDFL